MSGSITSANASISITIPGVYSSGVLFQQFAVNDILEPEPQTLTETRVGADGDVVGGYVFNLSKFRMMFQANSDSIQVFYNWKAAQDKQTDVIAATMKIIAPALGLDVDLEDVYCESLPFLPPLKKVAEELNSQHGLWPRLGRLRAPDPVALKEADITITEGRDAGKTFHLKEWPALRVEHWIMRAVFGLGRAGVELPPEILQLGAGPTAYAIASQAMKMPSRLGLKLADELMECVTIVKPKMVRSLVENDIEDFSTRLWLKGQVLKLTFGFFVPAAFPTLTPAAAAAPGK